MYSVMDTVFLLFHDRTGGSYRSAPHLLAYNPAEKAILLCSVCCSFSVIWAYIVYIHTTVNVV